MWRQKKLTYQPNTRLWPDQTPRRGLVTGWSRPPRRCYHSDSNSYCQTAHPHTSDVDPQTENPTTTGSQLPDLHLACKLPETPFKIRVISTATLL